MALQAFVAGGPPTIKAVWLNKVDVLMYTVFSEASTVGQALTALGAKAFGVTLFQCTLQQDALDALGVTATGKALMQAASQAAGRSAITAAGLNGSAAQAWAALSVTMAAGTTSVAPLNYTAGVNLTTATAGTSEYDGKCFYYTPVASNRGVLQTVHFLTNTADVTGSNVNTAQSPFSPHTTITLAANTTYFFDILYSMSRAAGSTSHTIGVSFGGTATFTSIGYMAESTSSTGNVLTGASRIWITVATNTAITAASTSTTENNHIRLTGVMRTNGAGTIIPQFTFSAAPGGAPTIRANSFCRINAVGADTVADVGNWS